MNNVTPIERERKPIEIFRDDLQKMELQFKAALPAHIPVERFSRVLMTAIQNNPKLLNCTRASLFNACMKAAQDGLLPDGRDGAIVPYGENEDGAKKSELAQWMPMIGGIRKKARNSGEIKDWYVEVVYDGDKFQYQKGDDPRLFHEPVPPSRRTPGKPFQGIIAVYSIAILSDGTKTVPEVMWIEEIEKIRAKSKAKKGPWSDPTFYPEMCKKTVARRHSKSLPSSTDLDDLIRADDDLYDLDGARDEAQALAGGKPQNLSAALDNLATLPLNGKQIEGTAEEAAAETEEEKQESSSEAEKPAEGTPPKNPEKLLKDLDAALAKAQTLQDAETIWNDTFAPRFEHAFPPDQDKAKKIRLNHAKRFDQ